MRYFVLTDDGGRYGPADVETLTQWAQEGRLLAHQMLEEEETGRKVRAAEVAGIRFGPSIPGSGNVAYPRAVPLDASKDLRHAWIYGVVQFVCCCPLLFGILGLLACQRAETKGANVTGPRILCILGLFWSVFGAYRFAFFPLRYFLRH